LVRVPAGVRDHRRGENGNVADTGYGTSRHSQYVGECLTVISFAVIDAQ
jgi:hypothetical protein